MTKKRLSARINPHNFALVQTIADSFFYDKNKNKGNVSKALDWIIFTFRNDTHFKGLMNQMMAYNRYQRGSRAKADIEARKQLLILIKMYVDK
jgi:hypothetical protein